MSAHSHHCPGCGRWWTCSLAGPVWDQDDSDCRWFEEITCQRCMTQGGASNIGFYFAVAVVCLIWIAIGYFAAKGVF